MKQDEIVEIGIDDLDRLYIKPKREKFTMIHRSAAKVRWDKRYLFLYSQKSINWSHLDWYKHITSLIKVDYQCQLNLTDKTLWVNVSESLKNEIEAVP